MQKFAKHLGAKSAKRKETGSSQQLTSTTSNRVILIQSLHWSKPTYSHYASDIMAKKHGRDSSKLTCFAFHGQFSSAARMRIDCGNPSWIDHYVDWKRQGFTPEEFASRVIAAGFRNIVLAGYLLGGDFTGELTHTPLADHIRGIIVYESPLLRIKRPRSLNCPVCVIWNNYQPRFWFRREEKANTIKAWNLAFNDVDNIVASHKSHMLTARRWPFLRQAWDQGLNGRLGRWIAGIE